MYKRTSRVREPLLEELRPGPTEELGLTPIRRLRPGPRELAALAAMLAFAGALALTQLSFSASASTTGPISWSAPQALDTQAPYSNPNSFTALSCPESSLCVGNTFYGDIVTSSDPTGGSAADWSVLPSSLLSSDATGYALGAVSCATGGGGANRLCATGGYNSLVTYGASGHGVILTSTDPTGGKSAWSAAALTDKYGITAVQCPSTSACFALDGQGNILSYSAAAEPPSWAMSAEPISSELTGLSCPSATLCVAAEASGKVRASSTPATLTKASWKQGATGLANARGGVSCPSSSYCVVLDGDGSAGKGATATTTDPAAASPAWTTHAPGFEPPMSFDFRPLTCATDALCLLAAEGKLYASTHGGEGKFEAFNSPSLSKSELVAVSCAAEALCVGGTQSGAVTNTTEPGAGTEASWSAPVLAAPGSNSVQFGASSCPSSSLCVGTDRTGRLFTYAGSGFEASAISGSNELATPVCPSTTLCVTTDSEGKVLSSTDPAGGASQWRPTPEPVDANYIEGLTCPSTALCVGYDYEGVIVSSTDPAGGQVSDWSKTPSSVDPSHYIEGLTCPSSSLCVGYDSEGVIVSSTDPAGGQVSDWSKTPSSVDPSHYIEGLTCPSSSLCVGYDELGVIVSSTDPAGGQVSDWSKTLSSVDSGHYIEGLTCPSSGLCVGYDSEGNVLTSTDPTEGMNASWSVTGTPVDANPIRTVTCPSASLCLLTDDQGNVIESTDPAGGASAWTTISLDSGHTLQSAACAASASVCVLADDVGNVITGVTPTTTTTTSTSSAQTTSTTTTTTSSAAQAPPTAKGAPRVNGKTGEVAIEYTFPEPGQAEAYGEVLQGATVSSAMSMQPLGPGSAKAAARAKHKKCRRGYLKRGRACVNNAPVRYGRVRLAIHTAGVYTLHIKPSGKVRSALKRGKTLNVRLILAFTPAGATAPITRTATARLHLRHGSKHHAKRRRG